MKKGDNDNIAGSGKGKAKRGTKIQRKFAFGSVSLEPEIWLALREIAQREQCTVRDLLALIKLRKNEATSLSAAATVFTMMYFRSAATEEGHRRAGHGNFDHMVKRARADRDDLARLVSDEPE
ncbi:putative DNA-binding ribbon-helix-helix protein [Sphingobium sp. OAS761]|uniref:ribbon-helix-helix domain-containing protein n=1 Tax=Sphingobium sp. OAS761 TaxID=2817901 RepID=UPI0020A0E50F|nr:ribbon-helix-helix domain-containing protein [Sphingobium sp. OAS761]MCP1469863.1 putative DNA-binding ribbon-helix-helix protein [Sphingobium sp. OAS761]